MIAVLQDGVRLAAWVGRSRKAARLFLDDEDIPWGHQVAVMYQILCALELEVPAALLEIRRLSRVSSNIDLACEPWGHMDHCNDVCECLSSDRTGAYVHGLLLATPSRDELLASGVSPDVISSRLAEGSADDDMDLPKDEGLARSDTMRLGSVPFVSHHPGAYGRLLLAVYVRCRTDLLAVSDWLRHVMRGVWRVARPITAQGLTDVS